MQLISNWIKQAQAEVDANQKRFFDLISKALPKMGMNTRMTTPGKHGASKRGAKYFHRDSAHASRTPIPTNHQRVVMSRAARLGLSVHEYQVKYPRG
jgi:hypothetical protein